MLRRSVGEACQGRRQANELARRGFVALCTDAFHFASQRLDVKQVCEYFTLQHPGLDAPDPVAAVAAFNGFAQAHEQIVAKYLFALDPRLKAAAVAGWVSGYPVSAPRALAPAHPERPYYPVRCSGNAT